ncbi:partial heterodisulfide reductase subunit C2, partial [Anaerolineae bacterium]
MKRLAELSSEIDKCVRCGTCRSTCPTFKVIGRETSCARGRVTLIAEHMKGGVGLTETYLKHLKECTLCGACKSKCPNGVDTVAIFAAARREATEKKGVPFAASVIFRNLLASGGILSLGVKLATRLQGL